MKPDEATFVVGYIKTIIKNLRNIETSIEWDIDDGERIESSKAADQIQLILESYASRNMVCIKHTARLTEETITGEHGQTIKTQVCQFCKQELC